MERLGHARRWQTWVTRVLHVLGAGLVLAGIIYFCAYNWLVTSPALRFGLVELAVLGCLLLAWHGGLDRLAGKLFLLAASVLVGVFLAVFGQIYQTGADAYELFLGWALLISVWVLGSRFAALWFLWLVVWSLALALAWTSRIGPERMLQDSVLCTLLALIQMAFLAGYEYGRERRLEWLALTWPRNVLVPLVTAQLGLPVIVLIIDDLDDAGGLGLILTMLAAVWVGYRFYRRRAPDLFALTSIATGVASVAFALYLRVAFEIADGADEAILLVSALVAVALFTALFQWMRRIHREMQGEASA